MQQDLRFYEDQLYNPHASEYYELYKNVTPRGWKVWGSLTGRGSELSRNFLADHSLCRKWWEVKYKCGRLVAARDSAYHQIKVLAPAATSWYNDTLKVRGWFFKLIRLHVCKNWLALVRVVVGRAHWCNDLVAGILCKQLEAWFATVPHADVRWSIYVDQRRKYRVCWWNS
jgi:hypothetical protein